MSDSMKAYLAANYMSGPKADAILAHASSSSGVPKKKKRKLAASTSSNAASFIQDHDALGWTAETQEPQDGDDSIGPVVASDRAFRKRHKADEGSGWATVRDSETVPADERPLVVGEEPEEEFKGGLMTAAQLKKKFGKKRQKEDMTQEEIAAAQETVYRDSTGKKIDTSVEKAEAARKKREREEQEAKKMEWGKGLVQRDEAERQKKELEALKAKPFARAVDDVEMNAEMRSQERWNDPAAAFLIVSTWMVFHFMSHRPELRCYSKRRRRGRGDQSIQDHPRRLIDLVLNLDIDGMVLVSAPLWYSYMCTLLTDYSQIEGTVLRRSCSSDRMRRNDGG